jgi:hypothetical protein
LDTNLVEFSDPAALNLAVALPGDGLPDGAWQQAYQVQITFNRMVSR